MEGSAIGWYQCAVSWGIVVRYIFGKAVQVLSWAFRALLYVAHVFRPQARFKIPPVSAPLLKAGRGAIPRVVWQTNYTHTVTLPIYVNYHFNRLMAPRFEFRWVGDDEADEFVRTECSERTWNNYKRLQIGAARADFWRILVLYAKGGVYMDVDATLVWPLGSTIGDNREVILYHGERFTNFFMASEIGNPHLMLIVDRINQNIEDGVLKSVFDITGPTAVVNALAGVQVNSAMYSQVCREALLTSKFFQYRDRPGHDWGTAQTTIPVIRPD